MWEKMYQMTLDEKIENYPNSNSVEILIRVPNGWVYIYGDMQGTSSVFIPFSNEFQRAINSVCDCCVPRPEDPLEYDNPICEKCGLPIKETDC